MTFQALCNVSVRHCGHAAAFPARIAIRLGDEGLPQTDTQESRNRMPSFTGFVTYKKRKTLDVVLKGGRMNSSLLLRVQQIVFYGRLTKTAPSSVSSEEWLGALLEDSGESSFFVEDRCVASPPDASTAVLLPLPLASSALDDSLTRP